MYTPRKMVGSLTAAVAVIAMGGLLDAAVAASAPAPAAGNGPDKHASMHGCMHGQEHGCMRGHEAMEAMEAHPGMPFMHVLHQLELSDAQRDKVHALMTEEHEKMGAAAEGPPADFVALGNPGDPRHAAAVEAAKQRAVEHVQHFSELEQKVYALLTPEQQAKLPKLLAEEQQHMQEHRAARDDHGCHDGHAGHEGHDGPPRK